jgi:hypothetical protein
MSNALAIAATTATLRHLLETKARTLSGETSLEVTTQPPDVAATSKKQAQLNLFLYQTTINGAWRNLDIPGQTRPGETAQPPLSLNLHYLVTAYGRGSGPDKDVISDRVLGAAMSVLHDHPLLGRAEIKDALQTSQLDQQFERLRVSPLPIGLEELSKLWMVFQTHYRVSVAYEVTVLLIDSRRPAKAALPVLRRGSDDRGAIAVAGAAPDLREIGLPRSQQAARLGEDIAIRGNALTVDETIVRFTSLRLQSPVELAPKAGSSPGEIAVHIPDAAEDMQAASRWAPGFYSVGLVQQRAGSPALTSNELSFALAPQITVTLDNTAPEDAEHFTVDLTVTCIPRVADQRVLLLFGDAQAIPTTTSTPSVDTEPTTFTFTLFGVKAGNYVVRLRVDGVDSIPVVYAGMPPVPTFDPAQTVSVS